MYEFYYLFLSLIIYIIYLYINLICEILFDNISQNEGGTLYK